MAKAKKKSSRKKEKRSDVQRIEQNSVLPFNRCLVSKIKPRIKRKKRVQEASLEDVIKRNVVYAVLSDMGLT